MLLRVFLPNRDWLFRASGKVHFYGEACDRHDGETLLSSFVLESIGLGNSECTSFRESDTWDRTASHFFDRISV